MEDLAKFVIRKYQEENKAEDREMEKNTEENENEKPKAKRNRKIDIEAEKIFQFLKILSDSNSLWKIMLLESSIQRMNTTNEKFQGHSLEICDLKLLSRNLLDKFAEIAFGQGNYKPENDDDFRNLIQALEYCKNIIKNGKVLPEARESLQRTFLADANLLDRFNLMHKIEARFEVLKFRMDTIDRKNCLEFGKQMTANFMLCIFSHLTYQDQYIDCLDLVCMKDPPQVILDQIHQIQLMMRIEKNYFNLFWI